MLVNYPDTHTDTHTPHTWGWGLVVVFGFLWRIGNYCNIFGKFLCNRKVAAKEIASQLPLARRSAWRHDATATCGSVEATSTSQLPSQSQSAATSTSSHSANWLRLCDAVVAFTLLWRLWLFIFIFIFAFRFVFLLLSVFGSCHSPLPHATCRMPHSTLHTRLRLLRQLEHKINVVCASVKSTGSCCGSGPKRKTWATNLKLILTPFVIAINCATFGRIDPGRLLTVECIKPYAIADAFRPAAHSTLHTWA